MTRALVTRPRAEAESLAAALARRGIDAVVEPLIEIAARAGPPLDLAGAQAILCTSANGVRALAAASAARDVTLLAVGDATARAARAAGFADIASAGGDVDDLARLARERLHPAAGRLVHVTGSEVAGDLAGQLAASGFAVERAVLYDAHASEALSRDTARLIAGGAFDLALFFSPRSAAIFARLVVAAGIGDGLGATAALSISAAADAALAGLRFRARHVAAAPTQAALLACLDATVRQPAEASS
ncbi:MAG TPA: uroporphyrinogen-III synthase [Stellaceae bacterium]|jgi:uroporphyrinogen-III synthase|nr:uroporphyrinogen-III synthase [Stellaceae bacterium]